MSVQFLPAAIAAGSAVAGALKKKPGAPDTPDFNAVAEQQGRANIDAARVGATMNRPNEYTPLGSRTWTNEGDKWTSTINLSPEQAKLLKYQNTISKGLGQTGVKAGQRVNDAYSQGFNLDGIPGVTTPDMASRQNYANALRGRSDERFGRDEEALRTRMANQGITLGSEAWSREMGDLNDAKTDAFYQADLYAGDEMARQYGLAAAERGRATQEAAFLRDKPISELNALREGSQPNMPQFQAYSPISAPLPPNYMQGAQAGYSGQLASSNAAGAAANNTQSGLFGLAGSLGSAYMKSRAG